MNEPVAYVEAEFWGGDGTQACEVFVKGERVIGPLVDQKAINRALSFLKVTKGKHFDEFEAVGLNRHRRTESWIKGSNPAD